MEKVLTTKKQNYDIFDLVKLILSFMIVAIHTGLLPVILFPWLRLAVPMFFVISSYLFFKKVNGCKNAQEKGAVLKQFVLRNVILYAFWFIVLFPINVIARGWFDYGIINGIFTILVNLLLGSTFIASWFISALVIGTVIIFFASKKINNKVLLAISIVIYILVTIHSSYLFIYKDITIMKKIIIFYETYFVSPYNSFPVGIFWILCGKLFADGDFKYDLKSSSVNLGISLALLFGEWFVVRSFTGSINKDCYLMLAPCIISIFTILLQIKPIEVKNPREMRKISVLIYVTHGAVLSIIQKLSQMILKTSLHSIILFVLTALISLSIGLIILWLERYKPFKWLKYSH